MSAKRKNSPAVEKPMEEAVNGAQQSASSEPMTPEHTTVEPMTLETVRRDGAVRTHFGRIRPIPDIQSRNPNMRGFAERTAVNTPLQGTAADLIKLAMIALDRTMTQRGLRSRMTLQVHDELLFDVVPEEADELKELVKHEMEHVAEFSIPIIADVGLGPNWRDIQ